MMNFLNFRKNAIIENTYHTDIESIAEIHASSFSALWSEDEIAALLSQDQVDSLIVRQPNILKQRKILGFVICRKAADEAEILTIAVQPRQRKKGFGRMLVEALIRKLYRDGIKKLFLEVDDQNDGAVKLYQNIGFTKVGTREQYYTKASNNTGNAVIMRYDI